MGKNKNFYLSNSDKKKVIIYITGITILCLIIIGIFAMSAYRSKAIADSQIAAIDMAKDIVVSDDVLSSSSSDDKSVNEVIESQKNDNSVISNDLTEKIAIRTDPLEDYVQATDSKVAEEEPEDVVLEFIVPLNGEITKGYSDSGLVYSETLKEWTTHTGIDIKAEKGSAVCASESGTVESIKNDPRYGLTVTISHANGFKTIYSNLLSAEFVKEGETVEKGQTIGSVGSSGVFEIADSEHLHFEMMENGVVVNPANYWSK
ncbi:MAG: M23 family metallopeptidase [Clostridia bacterium]|nr:M23 family metallopeptidase [Clostridia bacterium]